MCSLHRPVLLAHINLLFRCSIVAGYCFVLCLQTITFSWSAMIVYFLFSWVHMWIKNLSSNLFTAVPFHTRVLRATGQRGIYGRRPPPAAGAARMALWPLLLFWRWIKRCFDPVRYRLSAAKHAVPTSIGSHGRVPRGRERLNDGPER